MKRLFYEVRLYDYSTKEEALKHKEAMTDRTKKGCKVEKNRQGNTGKVVMRFNGDLMKFEETNETVKEGSKWKSINDDNPF